VPLADPASLANDLVDRLSSGPFHLYKLSQAQKRFVQVY